MRRLLCKSYSPSSQLQGMPQFDASSRAADYIHEACNDTHMACREAAEAAEQHAASTEASIDELRRSSADTAAQLMTSNEVCLPYDLWDPDCLQTKQLLFSYHWLGLWVENAMAGRPCRTPKLQPRAGEAKRGACSRSCSRHSTAMLSRSKPPSSDSRYRRGHPRSLDENACCTSLQA